LRAILAVARREIYSFFVSPAAYVVVTIFIVTVSVWFLVLIFQNISAQLTVQLTPGARQPTLTDKVLRPFLMNGLFRVLWLVAPLISMRLLSEDRKQGTADLLLSSPITTLQLVLGKYLGALAIMAILFVATMHIPLFLVLGGNVDRGVVFAGYLGVFLTAAMFLAAGVFASSLTENQIVAALLTMATMLGIFLFGKLAEASQRFLGGVFTPFSLGSHLEDFIRGILDSSGFVYFLSMSAFFVFLTQRTIDSQRWR